MDTAHKKLKYDFKDLQCKFEKSLEKEEFLKNKISILEKENVECASCKSYMFDICILEKHLEDALENKNCEKFDLRKTQIRPSMLIIISLKIKLKELVEFGYKKERLIL